MIALLLKLPEALPCPNAWSGLRFAVLLLKSKVIIPLKLVVKGVY